MTQERSEEFIARLDRYADALIAKIGETEGKNWFEFADQTDRAGLYSLAETAIEVADKEHEELVAALDSLAGEVRACWGMSEPFLRQELGNTNYNIVELRLEEARATLKRTAP